MFGASATFILSQTTTFKATWVNMSCPGCSNEQIFQFSWLMNDSFTCSRAQHCYIIRAWCRFFSFSITTSLSTLSFLPRLTLLSSLSLSALSLARHQKNETCGSIQTDVTDKRAKKCFLWGLWCFLEDKSKQSRAAHHDAGQTCSNLIDSSLFVASLRNTTHLRGFSLSLGQKQLQTAAQLFDCTLY